MPVLEFYATAAEKRYSGDDVTAINASTYRSLSKNNIHLHTYNLTSFAVRLFTVAIGAVSVQEIGKFGVCMVIVIVLLGL